MVDAIVLAAGAGSRLRTLGDKPLLIIEGKSFLQRSVDNISESGIEKIVIVVSERLQGKLTDGITQKAVIAVNNDPSRGMLSSILTGAKYLDEQNSALVFPVDHPLVQRNTVSELLLYAQRDASAIIVPTYLGRRGHPTIFPSWSLDMLAEHNPSDGARWILHQFPDKVVEMPTNDEGVVIDIDTPENYRKYIIQRQG